MATVHSYTVKGGWTGDKYSVGSMYGNDFSTDLSIPANLGGPGTGTNPEELLLGAAYGCYLITLSSLLTNRKVPFVKIDLESIGYVENDRGLRYDRIEHKPVIYVDQPVDERNVLLLAEHAEHACMVSSALRGNVKVTVVPKVLVQTAQA